MLLWRTATATAGFVDNCFRIGWTECLIAGVNEHCWRERTLHGRGIQVCGPGVTAVRMSATICASGMSFSTRQPIVRRLVSASILASSGGCISKSDSPVLGPTRFSKRKRRQPAGF